MTMMLHINQVIPSMLRFNKPLEKKMNKRRKMKRKRVVFKNYHSLNLRYPIRISIKRISKRLSPPFK
jgi:hypothetical protein